MVLELMEFTRCSVWLSPIVRVSPESALLVDTLSLWLVVSVGQMSCREGYLEPNID